MSLSPMDIHDKQFDTKLRGYDEDQVDSFLDRIVDAYGDALDKNIDLQNENNELKKKVEKYEKIKDTLNQSLISAQENADEIKKKAQQEAKELLKNANEKADSKVDDLKEQYETLSNDYELLKGKVADFRNQTKKLLQDQLKELDDNDWQYYLDRYYGRSRLYPADGGQPVMANDQNESGIDKKESNEVNSKQTSQEGQPKILEGDSPSHEATPTPVAPQESGPTIVFPDDYKNHN